MPQIGVKLFQNCVFACLWTEMLLVPIGSRPQAVRNFWRAWESLDERGKVRICVGSDRDGWEYFGLLDILKVVNAD